MQWYHVKGKPPHNWRESVLVNDLDDELITYLVLSDYHVWPLNKKGNDLYSKAYPKGAILDWSDQWSKKNKG
jgi:hypothetical protein